MVLVYLPMGMPVALKRISKTAVTSLAELRDVAMELRALRVLSGGDGFLEFRDVLATRRYVYFVLEQFDWHLGYRGNKKHFTDKISHPMGEFITAPMILEVQIRKIDNMEVELT